MTDYKGKLNTIQAYIDTHDAYQEKRREVLSFGGEWVRWLRGLCKMSVRKFAAVLEITPSFLSKVENGKEPLSADLARKLLELHGK
jgi:DNA-binding transcriptional regulator YiaG